MRYDRGALSTELAVLTPLLIGFMLLAVYAGRVVEAEADVAHAAYTAARAASLKGDAATAEAAALETVAANIAQGRVSCRTLDVSVDTSSFVAGGQVGVTVTCEARFSDLALLAVPGARSFTATAVTIIDTHRADLEATP